MICLPEEIFYSSQHAAIKLINYLVLPPKEETPGSIAFMKQKEPNNFTPDLKSFQYSVSVLQLHFQGP